MEHQKSKTALERERAEEKIRAKVAAANRRAQEVMEFQRRRAEAEEAKFKRLRSLRLAKEAADKEELANSPSATAPAKRVKKLHAEAKSVNEET